MQTALTTVTTDVIVKILESPLVGQAFEYFRGLITGLGGQVEIIESLFDGVSVRLSRQFPDGVPCEAQSSMNVVYQNTGDVLGSNYQIGAPYDAPPYTTANMVKISVEDAKLLLPFILSLSGKMTIESSVDGNALITLEKAQARLQPGLLSPNVITMAYSMTPDDS